MDGTTALVPRNEPVRIVPISTFHMSSVCSSKPTRKLAPALLHRIDIGPNSCSVAATAAVHSSAWRTSSPTASERPSLATISAATASALSTNRSATHTAAPSLANNRAWAPPIAPPPPVITAVLPSSFTILDYRAYRRRTPPAPRRPTAAAPRLDRALANTVQSRDDHLLSLWALARVRL